MMTTDCDLGGPIFNFIYKNIYSNFFGDASCYCYW